MRPPLNVWLNVRSTSGGNPNDELPALSRPDWFRLLSCAHYSCQGDPAAMALRAIIWELRKPLGIVGRRNASSQASSSNAHQLSAGETVERNRMTLRDEKSAVDKPVSLRKMGAKKASRKEKEAVCERGCMHSLPPRGKKKKNPQLAQYFWHGTTVLTPRERNRRLSKRHSRCASAGNTCNSTQKNDDNLAAMFVKAQFATNSIAAVVSHQVTRKYGVIRGCANG
ncbi:hypothetical protein HPB51_011080 [Rhipicephalus microplus]|uniref:Uncharacterized protein n=1 Tax=Rhipicephalus microplus TaxID=6941 RepID=A0A9J6DU60_RHIMP|nr:hypothetical protein HPB51_011080 [Rhipicephalus microplus]